MFRPVRRIKNALGEEATKEILRSARRGVLAVNGDGGYPYAIPINYLYDEETGKIYFHGAKAGHKADSINKCDKVCFTAYGDEIIREEVWAPFMRSAVVFGRCRVIEDRAQTLILVIYVPHHPAHVTVGTSERLADEEIAASGKAVRMYEIDIEHMSGKEIQER